MYSMAFFSNVLDVQISSVLYALLVISATSIVAVIFTLKGNSRKLIALKEFEYIKFKLIEKIHISQDTRKFRFSLQSAKHVLGLPVGQHISMKMVDSDGKIHTRSYTPTSSNDEIGYVDFVIKVYFPNVHPNFPNGGKMSYYLENLKLGDFIEMRGPKGSLEYMGKGIFSIKRRSNRTVRRIGMIAGGTGITPMLQIMQAVRKEQNSSIELSLIFANQTEKDILLREDIEKFKEQYPKFKFHYTLDRPPESWNYSTGFVTDIMISNHMPEPNDDMMILLCGPPPMIKYACIENLKKLNYSEEMYFDF